MQLGGVARCHRGERGPHRRRWLAARAMISQFRFSRLAGTGAVTAVLAFAFHSPSPEWHRTRPERSRSQTRQQSRHDIRWPSRTGPSRSQSRTAVSLDSGGVCLNLHARCRIRRCIGGSESALASFIYKFQIPNGRRYTDGRNSRQLLASGMSLCCVLLCTVYIFCKVDASNGRSLLQTGVVGRVSTSAPSGYRCLQSPCKQPRTAPVTLSPAKEEAGHTRQRGRVRLCGAEASTRAAVAQTAATASQSRASRANSHAFHEG